MRILWISPHIPWPPTNGGKIRLAKLAGILRGLGWSITVLAVSAERPLPTWSPPPFMRIEVLRPRERPEHWFLKRWSVLTARLPEAPSAIAADHVLRRTGELLDAGVDLVLLEQSNCAGLLPLFRTRGIPVVLMTENVEHLILEQIADAKPPSRARVRVQLDAHRMRRFEASAVRHCDLTTAVSDQDRDALAQLAMCTRPVVTVPNGVDLGYFRWADHEEVRNNRLLFTAHLGYPPNVEGCRWFVRSVLPEIRRRIPGCSLDVVGTDANDEVKGMHSLPNGVHVIGAVPDVRPYFERADVYVIPLHVGGGTRLKALEALAAGAPVVSTTKGVEGLNVADAGVVLTADTAATFADEVVRAMSDAPLRRRLGLEGRRFVEAHHDWARIGADLDRQLRHVVGG